MKARPTVLIAFGVTSALVAASTPDFRQVSWGMSQAQVMAAEPDKPAAIRENSGEVIAEYDSVQVGGAPCRVLYFFAKDRLVRAKYVFIAEHDDRNDFIADYRALEPELREHYGKPTRARAIWEDDSTQLEPKSYLDQDRATPESILPSDPNVGLAVALGHLRLYTEWQTGRSKVLHALLGGDNRITHQVEYRSVELEGLENSVRTGNADERGK